MGLLTAALVAVGVGGGTFIAAPVIGAAAVGLLGFQAGGILAGSTAASMMSGSAIACGGGVPMAGLVATLQSIGVVGIGTGASAAAGAVTSGTAALIAILV